MDCDAVELRVGFKIKFAEDRRWFTVRAMSERFAICTRSAHVDGQRVLMYTIVDNEAMKRGPHNLIASSWDMRTDGDVMACMAALCSGEIELSRRRSIPLVVAGIKKGGA